jgi:hypothetical protein
VEYKKIENKISKYNLTSRVLDDNIYAKCWGCSNFNSSKSFAERRQLQIGKNKQTILPQQ